MNYRKEVTIDELDVVLARVFDENGRSKGYKHFHGVFNFNSLIQKRFNKAHKWADERIAICKKNETGN